MKKQELNKKELANELHKEILDISKKIKSAKEELDSFTPDRIWLAYEEDLRSKGYTENSIFKDFKSHILYRNLQEKKTAIEDRYRSLLALLSLKDNSINECTEILKIKGGVDAVCGVIYGDGVKRNPEIEEEIKELFWKIYQNSLLGILKNSKRYGCYKDCEFSPKVIDERLSWIISVVSEEWWDFDAWFSKLKNLSHQSFSRKLMMGWDGENIRYFSLSEADENLPLEEFVAVDSVDFFINFSKEFKIFQCRQCDQWFFQRRKDQCLCSRSCQNKFAYRKKRQAQIRKKLGL